MKSLIPKAAQYVLAICVGSGGAYFAVSFFSFFYTVPFAFILFSLFFSAAFTFAAFFLVREAFEIVRGKRLAELSGLIVLLLAGGLAGAVIRLCWQFPTLFNRRLLFMEPDKAPVFVGWALFAAGSCAGWLIVLTRRGHVERICASGVYGWIRRHLAGILLASLFFFTYFVLSETVNFPGFRTLDQYFDLDISAWIARLQADSSRDVLDKVRAVHPAVLLFLRPPIWLVSLFLNGDRLHAIFVVHALAAAACVFLAWRIVRRAFSNTSYALVIASLLGASASHFLLGSMLETYIYSALALLFFVSLLQNEAIPFKFTVLAGIFVFGITVTNLAQTVILYFSKQPRINVILRYGLLVVGAVFLLSIAQASIYPAAEMLTPSALRGEQRYQVNDAGKSWQKTGRIALMARALLLYGVVAPRPFILMEELGTNVPNFRTFRVTVGEFHVAGYAGLADITVKLWALVLAVAALLFFRDWFGKPKPLFALGLLACLVFNFSLHALYGDDPMLYSPDWVYALVLFVAFAFHRFADRNWFRVSSIVFLALVMTANVNLVRQIMEVSAPYYGR